MKHLNSANATAQVERQAKFLLSTLCPAEHQAWLLGYDAGQTSIELEDNPYDKDEYEFQQWQEGWWAGFYEEQKLYADDGSILISDSIPVQDKHINTAYITQYKLRFKKYKKILYASVYLMLFYLIAYFFDFILLFEYI